MSIVICVGDCVHQSSDWEGGGREVNECQGTGYNLFALAAYFLHARGGARSAFAVGTSGLRFRRLGLLVMVKVGSTGVPWTV